MLKAKEKLLKIKSIRIKGIKFKFKALSPQDFAGLPENPFNPFKDAKFRAEDQAEEKKVKKELENPTPDIIKKYTEKLKEFYTPIFMKAVIEPELVVDDVPDKICIDDLFSRNAKVANRLYDAIFENSVKKKTFLISLLTRARN